MAKCFLCLALVAISVTTAAAQTAALGSPAPRSASVMFNTPVTTLRRVEPYGATPLPPARPLQQRVAPDSSHRDNRSRHAAIGAVIGFVVGVAVGVSADGGRAGCNEQQSGKTCDWTSGYEEPVLGLLGALLGGTIGALMPHD